MNTALTSPALDATSALQQGQTAPKLPGKLSGAGMASAKKAAQDFESFFASQMLGEMFSGIKTDSLFGGGHGEEMFRSVLLDSYAKEIGKHGSLGIGNQVMKQLLQQQEVAS